ncbi:MAG: hypothetical protein FJ143_17380 [Deltaproteobacteria bacterium]|nr:hypothetical protein [Deltaproteobacteria bacterium]
MAAATFQFHSKTIAMAISLRSQTRALSAIFLLIASVTLNCTVLSTAVRAQTLSEPALVLQSYLRATYARDFAGAYRYISSADRKVRQLNRYLHERGPFHGFALEVARKLSESIEIRTVQSTESPSRVKMVINYKVPDPQKLASWLFNWDAHRLNSSSAAERKQIFDLIEKKLSDASLDMRAGEQTFELIKENHDWRIFLNWAAGVKISLRLALSDAADWEASLSNSEVTVQPGELFEISLKVKNRSNQPVFTRIRHLIEPEDVTDYLDFVECGFLLPVTLEPGKEQAYAARYLLRGNLPEGVRRIDLTYDFRRLLK